MQGGKDVGKDRKDAGRAGMDGLVREAMLACGRVQGVGFRWYARGLAGRLGLTGFAMNMPDGSVAMEVQGPAEQVDAFAWHLANPPLGWPIRVAELARRKAAPVSGEQDFRIRRWEG